MTARVSACRFAAAIGLLVCTAIPASAQTPPPGGDERPTMRLGPFELRPRLLLNNIGVDNNVFNDRENPKRDFTFGAQPDLEITVQPGPLKIVWLSGSEFLWYHKYESERMVNRSSTVTGELDLKILRPFASYATAHTSARPSPEIDERARRHPRRITAGTSLKLATRTTARFAWISGREEFDQNEEFRGQKLAETLNSRVDALEGSVGLALTPLTTFSIVVHREELRFEQAPLRNADTLRVSPTLTFSPQGLISGALSVGYKTFTGVDPLLPEYQGLAMNGLVTVLLGSRYRLETRLTRDVQYSYEETLPYYVLTGGRSTLATQISNLLDFRLTAGQDRMRYRAFTDAESPGIDRLTVYGGGVGFRVGDRKRFVIQAEVTERASDRDPLRGYKNHRIFGTLTWGA